MDVPEWGLHDVECHRCDGTGTIESALEDAEACHSAWIDMVQQQDVVATEEPLSGLWEVAA